MHDRTTTSSRKTSGISQSLRPFVFISIPRTASSSVHFILGLSGPKDFSTPADAGLMDNHSPWDMVVRRYGREEFDRRYKFCFVRNPWDRCVSWYCHHVDQPPYDRYTFKDWIRAGMPHHWNIQNGTVYQNQRTPLEQFRFIADDDQKLVVDFVGRVERFPKDMAAVAKVLGCKLPRTAPRINRAKGRLSADYRTYYDDQTAELVGKMLAPDIRLFGYSF
jgi:hypothetical protein